MILCKLIGYDPETDIFTNPQTQEIENIPDSPFVISDIIPQGYEDYSSIVNWYNCTFLDWARRRDNIKPLFYIKAGANLSNYASLTDDEKWIGNVCFLVPLALRLQLWSSEDDQNGWARLIAERKKTRSMCVAEQIRIGSLTLTQTQMFDKDTSLMISWYERSDALDFKQWLTNEAGSPYENDGFAEKTYYSQVIKGDLLNIYNGDF
jgi:hypothetical protein